MLGNNGFEPPGVQRVSKNGVFELRSSLSPRRRGKWPVRHTHETIKSILPLTSSVAMAGAHLGSGREQEQLSNQSACAINVLLDLPNAA